MGESATSLKLGIVFDFDLSDSTILETDNRCRL